MVSPKLFPTLMIVLHLLSAITYAINDFSDWRKIGYFTAGAVLTYCVTY
jgi:hypothetical protein